jgi:hypothetical protein
MTATIHQPRHAAPKPARESDAVVLQFPGSGPAMDPGQRLMAYTLYACPAMPPEQLRRAPAVRRAAHAAQAARGA